MRRSALLCAAAAAPAAAVHAIQYRVIGTAHFSTSWVEIDDTTGAISTVAVMGDAESSMTVPAAVAPNASALATLSGGFDYPGQSTQLRGYDAGGSPYSSGWSVGYPNRTAVLVWDAAAAEGHRVVAVTSAGDAAGSGPRAAAGADAWVAAVDVPDRTAVPIARLPAAAAAELPYIAAAAVDPAQRVAYVAAGSQIAAVPLAGGAARSVAHGCAGEVRGVWWHGALLALVSPASGNLTLSVIDTHSGGCTVRDTLPVAAGEAGGRWAALRPDGAALVLLDGQTTVRRVDLATGKVSTAKLPPCGSCAFGWVGYPQPS